MAAKTKTKKKKKDYGELGRCVIVKKGKRCKRKAVYQTGGQKLCAYHYYHEPEMSKFTRFKPVSRKGVRALQRV